MALTLICPDKDPAPWIQALTHLDPDLDIRVWPEDHPRHEIELALTWAHPPGVLNNYPNLGCISSMGAGVDHLLSDPNLPLQVPIVRLIDQELITEMADYLTLSVLSHFRQFDIYQTFQAEKTWQPLAAREKSNFPLGIMGMGQLGTVAGRRLLDLGFPVSGWKNSPGDIPGITAFYGMDQLTDFLAQARILICLLPLTDQTRQILNLDTFSKLPGGAYLINVGRGGHLREADLIPALEQGLLSGACLDVFEFEPLGSDHPFWNHPGIRITPHVSSQTSPSSVAPQVLENLNRLRVGQDLLNPVHLKKGY